MTMRIEDLLNAEQYERLVTLLFDLRDREIELKDSQPDGSGWPRLGRPESKGGLPMSRMIRMVHCRVCHPDGGDIDRDPFHAYALVWMDEDGTEWYPICPHCGQEMTGRYIWRNGHSADGWVPAD